MSGEKEIATLFVPLEGPPGWWAKLWPRRFRPAEAVLTGLMGLWRISTVWVITEDPDAISFIKTLHDAVVAEISYEFFDTSLRGFQSLYVHLPVGERPPLSLPRIRGYYVMAVRDYDDLANLMMLLNSARVPLAIEIDKQDDWGEPERKARFLYTLYNIVLLYQARGYDVYVRDVSFQNYVFMSAGDNTVAAEYPAPPVMATLVDNFLWGCPHGAFYLKDRERSLRPGVVLDNGYMSCPAMNPKIDPYIYLLRLMGRSAFPLSGWAPQLALEHGVAPEGEADEYAYEEGEEPDIEVVYEDEGEDDGGGGG